MKLVEWLGVRYDGVTATDDGLDVATDEKPEADCEGAAELAEEAGVQTARGVRAWASIVSG